MSESRNRIIRRILRVNHAGEHGAIAIYEAQIKGAGKASRLHAFLSETRGHEVQHREKFHRAMMPRGAKPCRMLFVWSVGGALLGRLTALLGDRGIMVCTAAVERTVHHHLEEQLAFLDGVDPELAAIVRDVQREEVMHLEAAEAGIGSNTLFARMLRAVVSAATFLMILASTRGDNLFLRRQMGRCQVGRDG